MDVDLRPEKVAVGKGLGNKKMQKKAMEWPQNLSEKERKGTQYGHVVLVIK